MGPFGLVKKSKFREKTVEKFVFNFGRDNSRMGSVLHDSVLSGVRVNNVCIYQFRRVAPGAVCIYQFRRVGKGKSYK